MPLSSNPYGLPPSDAQLASLRAAAARTPPNSAARGAVETAIAARRWERDARLGARREAESARRNRLASADPDVAFEAAHDAHLAYLAEPWR